MQRIRGNAVKAPGTVPQHSKTGGNNGDDDWKESDSLVDHGHFSKSLCNLILFVF